MLFSKKTAILLSSAMLVSALAACSSGVAPVSVVVKGDANFVDLNSVTKISQTVSVSKQDASHFYVDAGNGQKTGASFSVKLDFSSGGAFKAKASDDGTASKVFGDITGIKVALLESATQPTGATSISTLGKVIGGGAAKLIELTRTGLASGATTITFSNVPENTTLSTDNYWIAAAAFQSTTNITNVAGATFTDGTDGAFYVTGGGGGVDRLNTSGLLFDTFTVPAGSVKVGRTVVAGNINYFVSTFTALTMDLKLRDAIGARVDSAITITPGSDKTSVITPS
ncbi:MAG: hypothetical protein AABZ74_02600 [Cyanobacteriota bacterium]